MKINFISDTHGILENYRGRLIKALTEKDYYVQKFSLNEAKIIRLILTDVTIVSSNLRSNLFALFFCRGMNVVIFNGLGRWRNSKIFRYFLLNLIIFKNKNSYVFQNYADFRYFMRFARSIKAFWICGSGGTQKVHSSERDIRVGVVTRSNKLELQTASILAYEKAVARNVSLIGVDDAGILGFRNCDGHVDPGDIFLNINELFLPDGYGEGFPHVACDALTSGMPCWMSNVSYIRYGLAKMDVAVVARRGNFICVRSKARGPKSKFSNEQILDAYLRVVVGIKKNKCV